MRAEEEKKIQARHLYLHQKKSNLTSQLKNLRQQKNDILREEGKIQHLEEEVARLTSLISREEKRNQTTKFENQEIHTHAASKPLNKERIGRLISLLFRDGLNRSGTFMVEETNR